MSSNNSSSKTATSSIGEDPNEEELGLVFRGKAELSAINYGAVMQSGGSEAGVELLSSSRLPRGDGIDGLDRLLDKVAGLMEEAVLLRGSIQDLSDSQAAQMRAVCELRPTLSKSSSHC